MFQSVKCSRCGNDILAELVGRKQVTGCPKCGASFEPREVGRTQTSARRQASVLCALIVGAAACFSGEQLFFPGRMHPHEDFTPSLIIGSLTAGLLLASAFVAYRFFGHWASNVGCAAACIIISLVIVGVLVSAFGITWLIYGGLILAGLFVIAAIAEMMRWLMR